MFGITLYKTIIYIMVWEGRITALIMAKIIMAMACYKTYTKIMWIIINNIQVAISNKFHNSTLRMIQF
jgi:general stress protein CsbA